MALGLIRSFFVAGLGSQGLESMAFGLICLIFVAGLGLIALELFIPGGVLGFIGMAVLVTSIVLAAFKGPWYAVSLVVISLVILPIIFVYALRRLTLSDAQRVEDGYVSAEEGLDSLVGQEGVAITCLRPAGAIKVNGRRVDVVAESTMIDAGCPVKVIQVEGSRIVVRHLPQPTEEA